MTRPTLDLTAKDCTDITLVGHDYAAVRYAFENTAKTFTSRSILVTRPALDLTAKDCTAITLVGHDYATEHREYSVPSCLHIYLHAEFADDVYNTLLSTIARFRLAKFPAQLSSV